MMPRALLLVLAVLAAACQKPADPALDFAPGVGAWRLAQKGEAPAGDAPEQIRRFGVRRVETAEYSGPGRAVVEVFTLASEAGGLELEQTWRPAANTVVFHRGNRFAVVRWEGAGRDEIGALVRDLEKRLSAR